MLLFRWVLSSTLLFSAFFTTAQNRNSPDSTHVSGRVFGVNDEGEALPLPGATLRWAEHPAIGSLSDAAGHFRIALPEQPPEALVVFAPSFEGDTLTVHAAGWVEITLSPYAATRVVITAGRGGSRIDALAPQTGEVIGAAELTHAACCSLSESFTTNAAVDAVYTDGVTGAREIRLLGLAGPNTQLLSDVLPLVRSLHRTFGPDYSPSTWVQQIRIGKGPGSVVNGYEGIAGQIDVTHLVPSEGPPLLVNLYGNGVGRTEGNLATRWAVADDVHANLLFHGSGNLGRPDRNNDGFLDRPRHRTLSGRHLWRFDRAEGTNTQIGVAGVYDDRFAGQTAFRPGAGTAEDSTYGLKLKTRRVEVFGKSGHRLGTKVARSLGVQAYGTYHQRTGGWGFRNYDGEEQTAYVNLIYGDSWRNTAHGLRAGTSFLFDRLNEQLDSTRFARTEYVPGVFGEYTGRYSEKITLVLGIRADYHNLYGWFYSPRAHLKLNPTPETVLRLSAGRGTRVPNPLSDNFGALVSSRVLVVEENLLPEVAWNQGLSALQTIAVGAGALTLAADYFYTVYENQFIADRDVDPQQLRYRNLNGRSDAHALQLEVRYSPFEWLAAKVAYKYTRVQLPLGGERQQAPLTPPHLVHSTLDFTRKRWMLNLMAHWNGPQRLPSTAANPEAYQRPDWAAAYVLLNAQFTWKTPRLDLYLGAENLLNVALEDALIAADAPLGPFFDAGLVPGPLTGVTPYVGLRLRVGRE